MPSKTTNNGYTFTYDQQDAGLAEAHAWYGIPDPKGKLVYIARSVRLPGRRQRTLKFHREALGAARAEIVDHIDGNGLNNCRSNLRVCTNSQNCCNARLSSANTSGFKGVSWHKQRRVFRAYYTVLGRKIHIGSFASAEEAGAAYDAAALKHYGEFARTNQSLRSAA